MLFDTHTHINDEKYTGYQEVMDSFERAGGKGCIVCGCDFPSSISSLEIAEKHKNVYATIGMHPHDSKDYSEEMEQYLIKNADNPKVVAIGEIGLDYYYDLSERDIQKKVFVQQIKLADQVGLPIVFHIRDAMGDFLDILQENKQYFNHGGVVHSFSGSLQIAEYLIKFGFYLSFNGIITFKNANKVLEVIRNIPLDRILIETDCPYLTPEPFRGQINRPQYVELVAKKIAELKGISLEDVLEKTFENARRVFTKITEI